MRRRVHGIRRRRIRASLAYKAYHARVPADSYGVASVVVAARAFVRIFCANAVNILAGINGVEVVQVLTMSMGFTWMDLLDGREDMLPGLMTSTSLALLMFNRYPASLFVGDTFTTYGGLAIAWMTFTRRCYFATAVMMLPQGVNFLFSLPQLVGLAPCPRHRLPGWDAERDVLVPSGPGTLLNKLLHVLGPMPERI